MAALTRCARCLTIRESELEAGWARITATPGGLGPRPEDRWFDLCPDCWNQVLPTIGRKETE